MSSAATLVLNNFPRGIDNTQRCTYVRGTVSLSAGTYPTGGLALSWAQIAQDAKISIADGPFQVTFFSNNNVASSTASHVGGGYEYVWNETTGNFQILAASGGAAGTGPVTEEMTNGTSLPAGVTNDIIAFEAVFVKNGTF